jgi:hypothetical protein
MRAAVALGLSALPLALAVAATPPPGRVLVAQEAPIPLTPPPAPGAPQAMPDARGQDQRAAPDDAAPDGADMGNSPAPPVEPVRPDNAPPLAGPQAAPPPSAAPASPAMAMPAPQAPPIAPAPPPPNIWVPRPVAELVALDKVTARATTLEVRIGKSARFGSLTIAVRMCDIRPPDQPADATAFLDITDSHPGGPVFHGWMLVAEPGLSVLAHPIYDVRLKGCHE